MSVFVEAPRANANEDHLQLIDIRAVEGQQVDEGALLFVLETTKAAVEVYAPGAGIVSGLAAKVGDFVEVGAVLCELVNEQTIVDSETVSTADVEPKASTITAKARKLAEELGVDLAGVASSNGRIGEAEVRAAAGNRSRVAAGRAEVRPLAPSANTRRAIIIGGGGHAACLIDALGGSGYEIMGCTDRALAVGHHVCNGISVIGTEDVLERLFADGIGYAFIGIGGAQSNAQRRLMFERASTIGFHLPPVIHPSAAISNSSVLGHGCHVLMGATIGPRCTIGNNVIVNQGSIVCHDSIVRDHAHLTPGAIIAGGVSIGEMTVIGMGTTVLMGLRVGADCLLHNGAHINSDVRDGTIIDAQGRRQVRT